MPSENCLFMRAPIVPTLVPSRLGRIKVRLVANHPARLEPTVARVLSGPTDPPRRDKEWQRADASRGIVPLLSGDPLGRQLLGISRRGLDDLAASLTGGDIDEGDR